MAILTFALWPKRSVYLRGRNERRGARMIRRQIEARARR